MQPLQHHHEPSRDHRSLPRYEPIRRQPAADAGSLPRLSSSGGTKRRRRARADHDALGHATAATGLRIPVTNIRNTSSPRWQAWLSRENRCLVPFKSFAEYAPEPTPRPKRRTWFGLLSTRAGAAARLRRDLDRVQGRPRHQVQAVPGPLQTPTDISSWSGTPAR